MAAPMQVGMLGILRRIRDGASLQRQGRDSEEGQWTVRDPGGAPRLLAGPLCEGLVQMGMIVCDEPRRAHWYPRAYRLTDQGRAAVADFVPPGAIRAPAAASLKCPVVVAAEALVAAYEAAEAGLPPPGEIGPRARFLDLARAVRNRAASA